MIWSSQSRVDALRQDTLCHAGQVEREFHRLGSAQPQRQTVAVAQDESTALSNGRTFKPSLPNSRRKVAAVRPKSATQGHCVVSLQSAKMDA
jgi:hypothetical protein